MIKNKNSLRGFTLLELIVVIAIIGVLSVVILPSFTTALSRARDGRKVSELKGLQTNLLQWAQNNGGLYPGNMSMTTLNASCTAASATGSLCAIVKAGIDTRLPSGAYDGTLNYVGVGCYTGSGVPSNQALLCQGYQLWTDLETTQTALSGDADVSSNTASLPGVNFVGTYVNASITANSVERIQMASGTAEACLSTVANDCIYDLVP